MLGTWGFRGAFGTVKGSSSGMSQISVSSPLSRVLRQLKGNEFLQFFSSTFLPFLSFVLSHTGLSSEIANGFFHLQRSEPGRRPPCFHPRTSLPERSWRQVALSANCYICQHSYSVVSFKSQSTQFCGHRWMDLLAPLLHCAQVLFFVYELGVLVYQKGQRKGTTQGTMTLLLHCPLFTLF